MITDFDVAATPLSRGTTLIEASAGTGKTYTIAGLFLRLVVEEGLRAGQILVTTYTVPATAELRDRIRKLLRAALDAWTRGESDDFLLSSLLARGVVSADLARRRLAAALRAFDEAPIHTIHGFCQRVLQDRAFESRVLFDAELITDQSALLREVAEDYWRRRFYGAEPAVVASALVHDLAPAKLARLLKDTATHARLRVLPPPGGLSGMEAELAAAFAELRDRWPAWRDEVRRLFNDANAWAKAGAQPAVMEPLLALVDELTADPEAHSEAYEALDSFTSERLAEETRAKHTAPGHPFFQLCQRIVDLRERFGVAVEADFLAWGREELPRRRALRNLLSFDDLLTRLHAALHGPDGATLAALIRSKFPAALIDEFQDTDPVQAEIFRTVFGAPECRLYLIGDPKQAIYGFRGADVFSYIEAARTADRPFKLGTNFRSTTALVQAVNTIFHRARQPFIVDEIRFETVRAAGRTDAAPLRIDGQPRPPFHFLLPASEEPLVATSARAEIPAIIASEIARLLAGRAQLGEAPLAARDIAVLTTSNREARTMQAALAAGRVPSVLLSNASVFASREAAQLSTLLAGVAEPVHEALVRAALATTLLALTAAEIDALARDERSWESWLLRFQAWNARWRERGFIPMFRALLREAGVRGRLLGQPEGERALTNVLHLAELLHRAAAESRLAPAGLLQWLSDRRCDRAQAAEEHELRLERDEDAVRVVTIHKSKGLEYPVVFCPFAWGKAGLRDWERPLFHADALTLDLGSDDYAANAAVAQREKLAEQTRLLYVALTRAMHECHFVWGRFAKNEQSAAMWLLHPPAAPVDDPLTALAARGGALTPATLRAEIEALAGEVPEAICVETWREAGAPVLPMPVEPATSLRAREFAGRIERDWRVSSFTSLTEHREGDARDHDRAPVAGEAPDTGAKPSGIHAFPAGMTPGVCLHAIFEELDFTQPAAIAPLVAAKLGAFGFHAPESAEAVADCVRRTLAVELESGLRLATVPMAARLNELEFQFPVARLEAAALARVIADERLHFDPRRGLLRGFIDLVFEHAGRFYIVDWKSNRLGADTAAYHPEALRAAMARHHYGLQYHLYTLALHRYLGLRLGEGYDYEQHFGGVFYIFLRGVDPARPALGVFRDRPPLTRIAELDTLFSREP